LPDKNGQMARVFTSGSQRVEYRIEKSRSGENFELIPCFIMGLKGWIRGYVTKFHESKRKGIWTNIVTYFTGIDLRKRRFTNW
jgi:hypothetical protein